MRDALETWLGARPRFKEFALGHPLLIGGLLLWKKTSSEQKISWLVRLLLLGGLIGQISIINTFTHYHTPLIWGILRTVHGAWIGALLTVLVWAFLRRRL
jgi:hypothetical protein